MVVFSVVLVTLLSGTAAAQTNVTFPDPSLEAAVRSALGKPTDPVTNSDLETLISLTSCNMGITNLSGLEWATNLVNLDVSGNSINDLSPLAALLHLTSLNVGDNLITDGSAITGLKNLSSLWLFGNRLTRLTELTNLTGLTSLILYNGGHGDIEPLAALTNLSYLELRWNPLTNAATVLPGLTNLTTLYLGGTSISNVGFLQNLRGLTFLNLDHNQISDPLPLADLPNLRVLDLGYNPLTNAAQIEAFTNLTSLYLSGTSISNANLLTNLSRLTSLTLAYNFITNAWPLAVLTNLETLGLNWNFFADPAGLAGLTNLTSVWLDGNAISNVSVFPGLTALKALGLQNNQISDFATLGGLTNLVALFADYNRLTNITDLEHLPRLSRVQIVGNPLEVVSGSNATTIQTLKARDVDLAYLPTNQPPSIWISTNWFIAVNESSSLGFHLSDDVASWDQLLVTAESLNPTLIPNESISLSGLYLNRTLKVTSAANQTGTAMLTLTVQDAAGSSTVVSVQVNVLVPQPVSIPDPYLATAIRSTLNKPTGRLSSVDVLALTDLFAFETNIMDLSGLEWATNLASLYLSGNSVTNLGALQSLHQLTSFTLYNNNTANLSQLAGLTNLVSLSLVGNSISNLTFLDNLTGLIYLNLDNNQIADLVPLATLTNLNFLSLRQNRLTNLVPLQNLPRLTDVDLRLNLLDVGSNSPAMTVIKTLEGQGVFVNYLPQRGPPTFVVRPNWLIAQNSATSLSFGVSDNGAFASQFAVTAGSGSSIIIPNQNVAVAEGYVEDWNLSVAPATNQIGTTPLSLTATNDAGLGSSTTILVSVVVPLPLDNNLLEGTNLTWQTGGDALWFGQVGVHHGGGSAAQSGSIQNGQESWMETTLAGPGILTFWWKVSSEASFDWLEFSLDGLPQFDRISGEVDWEPRTVNIPRGPQVARWRYFKDVGYSPGLDTAWVDQVTFLPLSWLELVGRPNNIQCELLLHPVLGQFYQLQASTNLSAWFPLAVVTATNTAMPFVDLTANSSARFYRLLELSASSIRLQNPKWIANTFQLELQSPPGLQFEVQASADLMSWSGLGTISNALGTVLYTDLQATNTPKHFYRALLLP